MHALKPFRKRGVLRCLTGRAKSNSMVDREVLYVLSINRFFMGIPHANRMKRHRQFHRAPKLPYSPIVKTMAEIDAFEAQCKRAAREASHRDKKFEMVQNDVHSYLCNIEARRDVQNLIALLCEISDIRDEKDRSELLKKVSKYFSNLRRPAVISLFASACDSSRLPTCRVPLDKKFRRDAQLEFAEQTLIKAQRTQRFRRHFHKAQNKDGNQVLRALNRIIQIIHRARYGRRDR